MYKLIGGEVDHASSDEDDLSDAAKMLRRLYALNLMMLEGWQPDITLWQVREKALGFSSD